MNLFHQSWRNKNFKFDEYPMISSLLEDWEGGNQESLLVGKNSCTFYKYWTVSWTLEIKGELPIIHQVNTQMDSNMFYQIWESQNKTFQMMGIWDTILCRKHSWHSGQYACKYLLSHMWPRWEWIQDAWSFRCGYRWILLSIVELLSINYLLWSMEAEDLKQEIHNTNLWMRKPILMPIGECGRVS